MEPNDVDGALGQWCVQRLGAAVSEVIFEGGSLSRVVGVQLTDGREVVVKTRPSAARLASAYAVHRHVWRSGYPAPEPLVPSTPMTEGTSASAEQLVPGGQPGGRSSADAARSAQALASLIPIASSAGAIGTLEPSPSWVAWDHHGPGLWPPADVPPLDLNAVAGPDWLDHAATRCRGRLMRYQAPRVVGHADWHADNVRWAGDGTLAVVHDWDSVVSQPEAVITGIAGAVFPASAAVWEPATIEESALFLAAYSRASARAWTADDTEAFWAASAWTLAVDAKDAVATGSTPTLTATEIFDRLALAGG